MECRWQMAHCNDIWMSVRHIALEDVEACEMRGEARGGVAKYNEIRVMFLIRVRKVSPNSGKTSYSLAPFPANGGATWSITKHRSVLLCP